MRRWRASVMVALLMTGTLVAVGPTTGSGTPWQPAPSVQIGQQHLRPGDDLAVLVYHAHGQSGEARLVRMGASAWVEDRQQGGQLHASRTFAVPPRGDAPAHVPYDITLLGLPAGLYRLEVDLGGAHVSTHWLQVSDVAVLGRVAADDVALWIVHLATGRGVPGTVWLPGGDNASTDGDGLWTGAASSGRVAVATPHGPATLETSTWRAGPREPMAVYTDRPLYRPGQTVHAKVVAWHGDGPAEGTLQASVSVWRHGRQETISMHTLPLNEYGTAAFDVTLPEGAPLGMYSIQVQSATTTGHGAFRVEEYRLPEFRVDLAADRDAVAVGQTIDVLVRATRFYGEPIDEGEVRFEILPGRGGTPCLPAGACPVHTSVAGAATPGGVQIRPAPQGDRGPSSPDPPQPPTDAGGPGVTQLQRDGTVLIRILPEASGAFELRVRVTGVQGETIEQRLPFTVHAASLRVDIPLTLWRAAPDSTVQVPVRVSDLAGLGVDTTVTLEAVQRTWTRAGYNETPLATTMVQARDGHATVPVSMPATGSVLLRATVTDAHGRQATAERTIHTGAGAAHAARLQVAPAADVFAPGAPVELVVGSDQVHPVLVTLEADGLRAARIVDLAKQSRATLPGDDLPGRQAHAVVTQLRLHDDRMPTVSQASTTVRIDPAPRELQVEVVPDRDIYEDGETARILVRVTDAQGRPVQAEVSLAMVDEALLALRDRDDDILGRLLPTPWGGSPVSSLRPMGGGMVRIAGTGGATPTPVPSVALPAAAEAVGFDDIAAFAFSADGPPPGLAVRELFPETALWLPQASTDADGVLRVHAALPDTLTTWHLVAVAVSKEAQAGEGSTQLITRKDLVADLFAPRFLINGDEAVVQATVSNHMGVQRVVQVLLESDGIALDGAAARTLLLAPGRTGLVSYPVQTTVPGEAVLTFYAWSPLEGDGDALRIRFPVHPHGVASGESWAGQGAAEVLVRIPATIDGTAELSVGLVARPGDAVVDALPYLVGFPYGCVEQTMSRFLPAIAVAHAADGYGLDRSKVAPDLDAVVDAGLKRLYGFQHTSGAWGWWTHDADNPYMTAYVVSGLAIARDAGYDVDPGVLSRGVAALATMAQDASDDALGAYQRYALAVADPTGTHALPRGSSPAVAALGLLAAEARGDAGAAASHVRALEDSVQESGGMAHWPNEQSSWSRHGISSNTMLTAMAARGLIEHDPDHPLVSPAIEWLLRQRDGMAWRTTKDTAEAVLALAAFMASPPVTQGLAGVTVAVGGQTHHLLPEDLAGGDPLRIALPPGGHTLRITPDGGPLHWTASARYFETAEPIPARGDFTFERVVRDAAGKVVSALPVGQEATVTVTVRGPAGSQYVMVEDPLPAGVEVVPQPGCEWCRSWSHMEIRDDRVGFFATSLAGQQTFTYTIRAVWPGTYHVMPTRAEEMYDPDVAGHGPESIFRVLPHPGLQVGRVEVHDGHLLANLHTVGDVERRARLDVIVEGVDGTLRETLDVVLRRDVQRVEVPLPEGTDLANDTVRVVVRAGDAGAEVVLDPRLEVTTPRPVFGAQEEEAWASGGALPVATSLARGAMQADFATIFAGIGPEPWGDAVQEAPERFWGIPATPLGLLALLLAALAAARRPSGGDPAVGKE